MDNINEQGFKIDTFYLEETKQKPARLVYWKDLEDVRLSIDKRTLIFTDIRGKRFKMRKLDYIGWETLIQYVPLSFTNFDHQFVKKYLAKNPSQSFFKLIEINPTKVIYETPKNSQTTQDSFDWQEVKTAQLNTELDILNITFNSGAALSISNVIGNWHWLLKHVPAHLEAAKQIRHIFEHLTACDVCGYTAVSKGRCLVCWEEPWEPNELQPHKEDFIKQKQLVVFSTTRPSDKINYALEDSLAFDKNPNWKLLATEEEILAFSKAEYWAKDDKNR